MAKTRVFTAFDFDNDKDLRTLLYGQSEHADSPFEMADWSVKKAMTGDWQAKVRTRIRSVNQVIVMCGEYTDRAEGVSDELQIAQEEGKPYFLLRGRSTKICKKPTAAKTTDKMYGWTWANLKSLIKGNR